MSRNVCEKKVFEDLYEVHAESLRNFLYYKCGNLQQAEDITHDAFSKLWLNCAKVIFEKAKSFVFTTGKNLFLNQAKHRTVVLKFNTKAKVHDNDHEDPQFLMEHEEFKQKLEKAISELTEAQRVVFLMNRIDKLTYKQIAVALEISDKAVEKRMHNALKNLKNIHNKI